jgi:hypothetical protein
MSPEENEPLPRMVFVESIANEARSRSCSARQFARLALIVALAALVAALVGLLR